MRDEDRQECWREEGCMCCNYSIDIHSTITLPLLICIRDVTPSQGSRQDLSLFPFPLESDPQSSSLLELAGGKVETDVGSQQCLWCHCHAHIFLSTQ
ncbi:uncharacterized [Tachysurus ichikawai]